MAHAGRIWSPIDKLQQQQHFTYGQWWPSDSSAINAPLGQVHDGGAFVLEDGFVGMDTTPQLLALLTALKQSPSVT